MENTNEVSINKKKILYIVEAMGGGVFTYLVDLANLLSKDYDIYIAYATRTQTPHNYKEYFNENIKLIKVNNFNREVNLIKDIKAFLEIRKIANTINPDIIHLHSSKAGAIGRMAFNCKKRKIFYTPHGYSFLIDNCGQVKRKIYKLIESILGKKYCITIACSPGEYREAVRFTKNCVYINNGVNIYELENIIRSSNQINSKSDISVFTLGRICEQKNPELFNLIAERMPDIKFLWIGDGELRNKLSSPNIEITGWISREEAIKRCLPAKIFLLTSLWEGLPISLLEAMYMKKVCVVSNVIGNKDVINNNKNGYVCEEITDYIKSIEENINEKNNLLIEDAYNDIINYYNTEVMTKEYRKVYDMEFINE
jgi:glycosyltransferase involved in cell wall biosynthesis